MKLIDFFGGKYDHQFWKNRVSFILIGEFILVLMIAWVLRPVWIDDKWIYFPFQNYISGLGRGRNEGNIGAWIFMFGFCLFPLIGTSWNLYLYRQFRKESKIFAILLSLEFEFSLICVSFVGIFDSVWPSPEISSFMHGFGATYAFLGNTIAATLVFIAITIIYIRNPEKRKDMSHPIVFFLIIVELVGVYIVFRIFGNPFWQWMIMLSLQTFVFVCSRFFPDNLGKLE